MEAFKMGLIDDEKICLDMLDDRNLTAHIYDKETADEIFESIKNNYIPGIRKIIERLKNIS